MLSQWQHILRPIDCGPMRLKNRLTSAPINTGLENLSNLAALADFYAEAAADGGHSAYCLGRFPSLQNHSEGCIEL